MVTDGPTTIAIANRPMARIRFRFDKILTPLPSPDRALITKRAVVMIIIMVWTLKLFEIGRASCRERV